MNPLLSRRRFFVSAVFASLLGGSFLRAARGQNDPPDANTDLPAQTLHAIGVRMLREGRTFEKAADRFRVAAQKEPGEPSHQIALGCALASRAASLAYAALFNQRLDGERIRFAQTLQKWEQGREEFVKLKRENPAEYGTQNYDDTKPKLPPAHNFPTKDDNLPFRLTPAETGVRLTLLCKQAQQAWEKGIALSKTNDEKAQAFYIQGWGLRVLQTYLSGFAEGGQLSPDGALPSVSESDDKSASVASWKGLTDVPSLAAAQKSVEEAVRLAPQESLYRQALGDFLMVAEKEKAFAAYEKAAELAPKNSSLMYFMYQNTIQKGLENFNTAQSASQKNEPSKPTTEPFVVPLGYLHKAQSRDRANAWPMYEEAGILFRLAPYSITGPSGNPDATAAQKQAALDAVLNNQARKYGKEAIDCIAQGNSLPQYDVPHYKEGVPPLLAQVWQYVHKYDANFSGFARARELARSARGYAQIMMNYEHNTAEAIRANRAVIGMGLRMAGDWPTDDDVKTGKTVIEVLVAVAVCAIGYKGLLQTYEAANDKYGLDAATKENAAFQARLTEYKKILTARISTPSNEGMSYDDY